MSTIGAIIRTPLGAVLILVIVLVLAGLSVAAAISGALTAAAVNRKGILRCEQIPKTFKTTTLAVDTYPPMDAFLVGIARPV